MIPSISEKKKGVYPSPAVILAVFSQGGRDQWYDCKRLLALPASSLQVLLPLFPHAPSPHQYAGQCPRNSIPGISTKKTPNPI